MNCMWCETEDIRESVKDCYWIMPDGRLAVQILEVPAIECSNCRTYVIGEHRAANRRDPILA